MAIAIDIEKLAQHDPCEFAKNSYNGIARWRFLWTLLVFTNGAVAAVMLALAIIFAFDKQWARTVATGVGTVVTGVAMKWILHRRAEAKDEEEAAYRDVKRVCGADMREPDKVRRAYTVVTELMRRHPLALAPSFPLRHDPPALALIRA